MRCLVAVMLAGCSTFIQPPRSVSADGSDDCTTSKAAPIADSVIAGASLIAGAAFLVMGLTANTRDLFGPAVQAIGFSGAVGGLADAAIFSTSAAYGFRTVDACRAEKAEHVFAAQ